MSANDPQVFEAVMNRMLQALGASHMGFFHESKPRAGGKIALAATFMKAQTSDGARWVFQDVHPGGPADRTGIVRGDVLLRANGAEVGAAEPIVFQLGQQHTLEVRRADGDTATMEVDLPGSKEKKRPLIIPDQIVVARKLSSDIGLVFTCISNKDIAE